jgi:hypothetical protein
VTGELPKELVLDAGPIIALLHVGDPYHDFASAGFAELARVRTILLVPLPIVFEFYKWLAYEISPRTARAGLARIQRSAEIIYPDDALLRQVISILDSMPSWGGSLEDALVAVTGLRLEVPVWTLNYRDFGAFRSLHFWTPSAS